MKAMQFNYNDGGRSAAGFTGSAGDCVVRSIAIATGRPYSEVYTACALLNKGYKRRKGKRGASGKQSARNGVFTHTAAFKAYLASLGWQWTPTMGIGTGCTVHLCAEELPPGRLIVALSKHYTAVIDGVIHDTYNPSQERGTTIYPPHTPRDQMPKNVKWLSNGNGWAYAPARCVYGYWQPGPTPK